MKKAVLALILACAGCCTVPLLFPALAGVGVFGASLFHAGITLDAILCRRCPLDLIQFKVRSGPTRGPENEAQSI